MVFPPFSIHQLKNPFLLALQALAAHTATHTADSTATGTMVGCSHCFKPFTHTPTPSELARARAGVRRCVAASSRPRPPPPSPCTVVLRFLFFLCPVVCIALLSQILYV